MILPNGQGSQRVCNPCVDISQTQEAFDCLQQAFDRVLSFTVECDEDRQQEPTFANGLRGFLREQDTGKYLSIVDVAGSVEFHLSEREVSMFVCRTNEESSVGEPSTVAFQHEGVPALGRFLSCKAPRLLRQPETMELKCAGRGFSGRELFLFHSDLTIQHTVTKHWLAIESQTDRVILHASRKSKWEIDPTS
jgi:hypothetical protein